MNKPEDSWKFNDDDEISASQHDSSEDNEVHWTASEFVSHEKSTKWLTVLGVSSAVVAVIVYIVTRNFTSVLVLVALFMAIGFYALQKPRSLDYLIDHDGVSVGNKFYPFEYFRGFSVSDEAGVPAINLIPAKRFMTILSLYYEPKDEQAIVEILGDYLPLEEHRISAVDRLAKRLRF